VTGVQTPERCCRRCEYWDAGGLHLIETALIGDCLNSNSDRFNPEWNHCCPAFAKDSNSYEPAPRRKPR